MVKSVSILKLFIVSVILITSGILYAQNNADDVVHLYRVNTDLKAPVRLAIDASDNIYVADAVRKEVLKYNDSGTLLSKTAIGGSPISLAVNSDGLVFVGEEDGNILKMKGNGGSSVFYSDTIYPSDMAISPEDHLYVVDSRSKEVLVLDVSGKLIQRFGSNTLIYPTSIAYDSRNERIFVGEHGGLSGVPTAVCKVWVFDNSGNLLTSFGQGGNGPGEFYRIQGITIGKCGNIYVNDQYQGNVSVFSDSLSFITKFGVFGDSIGELNLPMDLIFDSQDRIIISSLNNGAIELFNVSDTLPTSNIANSDATICLGDSTDITIKLTGTAPWNFTYTIDGANPSVVTTSSNPHILTVADSGIYEITALSDANKTGTCFSGSANIKVNSVIPTSQIISPDDTLCEGEVANVEFKFTGASPWTFTYSIDSVLTDTITTTDTSYILPVTTAGRYEVSYLIGNSCSGVSMIGNTTIGVNPLPTSTFVQGNNRLDICQGDSVNLYLNFTGTSPWNFTYYIDEQNPVSINGITTNNYTLTANKQGAYEVIAISDSNCTNNSTITYTYRDVVIHELPTATISNLDTIACGGMPIEIPVTFTGEGPWDFTYTYHDYCVVNVYNWNQNPYTIYAYDNGSYHIDSVSDSYCTNADNQGMANITFKKPNAAFIYHDDSVNVQFFNKSDFAASYLWDFGDGQTSIDTNPTHTYTFSGTYTVSLTAYNGCGDSTTYETIDFSTSINKTFDKKNIKIYPNPTTGKVYVELKNNHGNIQMEVLNVRGEIIYKKNYNSISVSDAVDLSSFSNGIYFIRLMDSRHITTEKLILNK